MCSKVWPALVFVSRFRLPQLSTLPTAATGTAVNGANGDIAVTPSRTAELVSVAAPASVRSAAGPVHPAYAGKVLFFKQEDCRQQYTQL